MKIKKLVSCTVATYFILLSAIQGQLPIVTASSRVVNIRDGLHFKKGYWYIFPERKPDNYFVDIPRKAHRITFLTDKDSISFEVEYGHEYDFIILLNNKDSCYTRIIANYKKVLSYKSDNEYPASDTIPFRVGDNSKIYLEGGLNGRPLDIQFDLGNSGAPIIKKSSVPRFPIAFDDSIVLSNSDGLNRVPYSNYNKLTIAGLAWDSVPVAMAENMTWREDLVVGDYLFQDKIVEINYDRNILIIHDTLPVIEPGFTRHDIILESGNVPLLWAVLSYKSKEIEGWFLLDSGAYTSILDQETVPASNKMLAEAKKMIGLNINAIEPKISIGSYHFDRFNYTTEKQNNSTYIGLLGNDMLKRFNIIIDNKNGQAYLKPNSLKNEPYANPEFYAVRVAAGFLLLAITTIVMVKYRRRRRKNR